MKAQIIQSANRGVDNVVYECHNEETGCSYRLETLVYSGGEMRVVDGEGKVVKI